MVVIEIYDFCLFMNCLRSYHYDPDHNFPRHCLILKSIQDRESRLSLVKKSFGFCLVQTTFSIISSFSKASKSPSSARGSRRSLRTAENRQSSEKTLPEFSANLAQTAPADRSHFIGENKTTILFIE